MVVPTPVVRRGFYAYFAKFLALAVEAILHHSIVSENNLIGRVCYTNHSKQTFSLKTMDIRVD